MAHSGSRIANPRKSQGDLKLKRAAVRHRSHRRWVPGRRSTRQSQQTGIRTDCLRVEIKKASLQGLRFDLTFPDT